jgi:hypothetical protein
MVRDGARRRQDVLGGALRLFTNSYGIPLNRFTMSASGLCEDRSTAMRSS